MWKKKTDEVFFRNKRFVWIDDESSEMWCVAILFQYDDECEMWYVAILFQYDDECVDSNSNNIMTRHSFTTHQKNNIV